MWKLAKWAKNRETPYDPQTPTLQCDPLESKSSGTASTPKEKAEVFARAFFPIPPEADLGDISGFIYPESVPMPPITKVIESAIKHVPSNKVPGPDDIPNRVLKTHLPELLEHLFHMFNASMSMGYCPRHFRQSTTVVLRKPKKPDYTLPKAYRPIALLSTIGKVLEAIIATRIAYVAEAHNLLPQSHMGGRRGVSTEHALHLMMERIHAAWNDRQVVTMFLLDVSGAFDNVSHPRLLHNLRKRRICNETVSWIASFITDRTTKIKLPEYTSDWFPVGTGIPQGSPLSPILYLFYNADLLEICTDLETQSSTIGYIDDVAIMVRGPSMDDNIATLANIYPRAAIWSKQYASLFSPTKYQLMHLTSEDKALYRPVLGPEPGLSIEGHMIAPAENCKYLGLIIDKHVSWSAHVNYLEAKTTKRLQLLSCLSASTWELPLRIYARYISQRFYHSSCTVSQYGMWQMAE